jgi:hypothetical protein
MFENPLVQTAKLAKAQLDANTQTMLRAIAMMQMQENQIRGLVSLVEHWRKGALYAAGGGTFDPGALEELQYLTDEILAAAHRMEEVQPEAARA